MNSGELETEDESLVNIVANALYRQNVISARSSLEKIPFDIKDLPALFDRLRDETETAQVLIFGSYLEDRMRALILAKLHHVENKKIEDQLFGGHGPFDTFGSRITISYHLGWLSKHQKNALVQFQKIRNAFAHKAFKISLTDVEIESHLAQIDYPVDQITEILRKVVEESGKPYIFPKNSDISTEQRYLCKFVELAKHTFIDFLVLPSAMAYRISPNSIISPSGTKNFDELPQPLKDIEIAATKAVLGV